VAALLLQGWWITWNPVYPALVSGNEGVMNLENIRRLSFNSMSITSFLLAAFVVLCGLFSHANLRRYILMAVAFSGALVSVIGIALKLGGEPLMRLVWKPADIDWNDFALYRYHGNAGAFLNLAWPLILVFTRRAYTQTGSYLRKIIWTLCSTACATALFLNASKAALVIGLLILPWPFVTRLKRLKGKSMVLLAVGTALLVAGLSILSSMLAQDAAFQRMTSEADFSSSANGRIEAYQQYADAVPAVGFLGLGPGLFKIAFPYQMSSLRDVGNPDVHDYAHEDYLQTALEWGWLGAFWWFLLIAGGLYRAIKSYSRRELFTSKTEHRLVLAAILGVAGTLTQALIDFPLQVTSIRLFFFVLLAFCWASPKLLATPPKKHSHRKHFRLPIPSDELLKTSSR
jgi:hypothetical protein